jgi:3-hydroxybutyryl-CoA dehydrogenase
MASLPGAEEKRVSANQRVVVVGGGVMGADIAAIFAAGGHEVDIVQRAGKTRDSLPARFARSVAQLGDRAGAMTPRDSLREVPWHDVGIVVESLSEDLALKRQTFAELERLATADAILASNSSSFPISRIAEGLGTRRRMLNCISCRAHRAARRWQADAMTPGGALFYPDGPGRNSRSKGTRRIDPACADARVSLTSADRQARDVDNARATTGRYIAAGPIWKDLSGLDVHLDASTAMYPDLCNDTKPIPTLARKVAAGELGTKSGKGFYEWPPEAIAATRARYDAALKKGLEILKSDPEP